jgi:hypothetical protein
MGSIDTFNLSRAVAAAYDSPKRAENNSSLGDKRDRLADPGKSASATGALRETARRSIR